MSEKTWVTIDPPEKSRTYNYADGAPITFSEVGRVAVSTSGTHYLETGDGKKHIVAAGWRSITLDMPAWTF
jgi:hypothetical protein